MARRPRWPWTCGGSRRLPPGLTVDVHFHVRMKDTEETFDWTFMLPLAVGLACIVFNRVIRPGVALQGTVQLGVPGCPVAPLAGSVLSEGAIKACTEHGVHAVIGGERMRGDAQSAPVGNGAVKYIGVGSLLEALLAATVPGR
jgi:hypothetical protein